jgi:hypothetical protein
MVFGQLTVRTSPGSLFKKLSEKFTSVLSLISNAKVAENAGRVPGCPVSDRTGTLCWPSILANASFYNNILFYSGTLLIFVPLSNETYIE